MGLRTTFSELDRVEQRKLVSDMRALQGPRPGDQELLKNGRAWLAGEPVPGAHWTETEPRMRILEVPQARGVLLDIHGGGWCVGTAISDEKRLKVLGEETRLTTFSVEYRLAPEHPYPAGPEDCLRAARWLLANYSGKLFIRGASAGAHLAVSTLLGLKHEARRFSGAVLYYGVYDLAGTPSRVNATDDGHPDLSPSSMEDYTRWFLGAESDRRKASPLYADLVGMPPALMLVGTQDILLDDTLFLAARWAAAGSEVDLVVYPEAPHGFDGYATAMARDAQGREAAFLKT